MHGYCTISGRKLDLHLYFANCYLLQIAQFKIFASLRSLPKRLPIKRAMATTFNGTTTIDDFIYQINRSYEEKHKTYEDNFWSTKMNLAGNSPAALARTKTELDEFLGSQELLQSVRAALEDARVTEEQKKTLNCFEKTLKCYIIEDKEALAMKERVTQLETQLESARNHMELGYTDPSDGKFVKASSVQLRNLLRTSPDEAVRLACLEGLRSIGDFVVEQFCEIIKLRNRLARKLGYECFYDMKVTQAEGFNKKVLFGILDELEAETRPIMLEALATLQREKGAAAVQPHNTSFLMAGDILKQKDPYFPFENAVDTWARSFSALGITYRGATMRLDLCDRQGKYSNGFCHWPVPAWQTQKGEWVPSQTNFTSLATPSAIGSGNTALVTLMHEGGHAAHFANVTQNSPLFSQERAPTSVAYAENQSMFLDSLVSDAAWMGKYAYSREGQPLPWDLIEQGIRATHVYEVINELAMTPDQCINCVPLSQVFSLRAMLAVPYYEKALYELSEEDMTPARVLALSYEVEEQIQGMRSARPLVSVPHILSDESAAYYHGYVLAEMSVHQTRKHFMEKYGYIVDNVNVGHDLAEMYWKPGNSAQFLDLVKALTGLPLSSAAWVEKLREDTDAVVTSEREAYAEAIEQGPTYPPGTSVDLDMRVLLVHGDEVISDSNTAGLAAACTIYKGWVANLKA